MDDELLQLISDRVLGASAPAECTPVEAEDNRDIFLPDWQDLCLNESSSTFLESGEDKFCLAGLFDDVEPSLNSMTHLSASPVCPGKRKAPSHPAQLPDPKKTRPELHSSFADDLYIPELDLPDFNVGSPPVTCGSDESCFAIDAPLAPRQTHPPRASSVDSLGCDSSHSSGTGASIGETEMSAEYHFEQIQRHTKMAIAALRAGNYEKTKNIVMWAHDLKNKSVSELKKEAELAWEADKSKDRDLNASLKASNKKNAAGSTKRVEQFRKNMRRWMIGTQVHQIGVEWMVYARLEHLQAISKFILGPALPADPASPTAVAESINTYLGKSLPLDSIVEQLAEPEPGKRYAIGRQLIEELQARQPRKVPSLAFTMPADNDAPALNAWIAQLRELFPEKPAPRRRGGSKC